LRQIVQKDGRYKLEAVQFLLESLDKAVELAGREEAEGADRHVSGQELLAGMREKAREMFGPLAAQVWRSWGVHESMDWGRVVFMLVEKGMLNRQDNDTIEDFREGFDFEETFVDGYAPALPKEFGPLPPGSM
jgi:uncharacterized repeat protein (TIGR04138 family)